MQNKALEYKNKKGQTYYFHTKEVTLKNGKVKRIYYFAQVVHEQFALSEVPEGFIIIETSKTGLPLLKKVKKND